MWGKAAFGIVVLVILWCMWRRYTVTVTAAESFANAAELAAYASRVKPAVSTFSNTLQRRMGMGSAGGSSDGTQKTSVEPFASNSSVGTFDSYKQNFSSGDVGYGTMMAGYQRPSVLPLGRA